MACRPERQHDLSWAADAARRRAVTTAVMTLAMAVLLDSRTPAADTVHLAMADLLSSCLAACLRAKPCPGRWAQRGVSLVPCWRRQAAGSARLEALQVCWSASRRPRPGSNSARVRWTEAPAAPLPGGSVIRTAEPPEPTLDCTSDRFRHSAHTKRHGPNHRRWPPGCSTVFDRSMSQNRVFCLRCTR